jgi:hypothetical protein
VVLLPFCLAQSFQLTMSPFVKTPAQRIVDKWKWEPLNAIYGNPEDGVSGRFAVIWGSGADEGKQVQYMPDAPAWKRAYCWSALRNTADGLKYKFAWDGPLATGTVLGRHYQIGWKARSTTQGTGPALPVISI